MNLSKYKVIDNHCHLFLPEKEIKSFEQYWTLSRLQIHSTHLRNLLNYRLVVRELGRLLLNNVEESEENILEARKKLYGNDPTGYIKMLFDDAVIETVLLDTGVPNLKNYGYTIPVELFGKLLPLNTITRCIVRVEPIIDGFFEKKDLTFHEFITSFEQELEENIQLQEAVALKTAISYETGIEIGRVTNQEASKAYTAFRKNRDPHRNAEKQIRDYLFRASLEKCIQHDIPVQIHTGIGDAPVHDLRRANPLLLFQTLRDKHLQQAKIVLLHGGYPYLAETASLVNMYPNIWVDLSEMIPFASLGVIRRLYELFEMAPITKIVYGSDCYHIPEIAWFSAIYFKRCLGKVLSELVSERIVSSDYARFIAARILSENARELYKLTE